MIEGRIRTIAFILASFVSMPAFAQSTFFTQGNLVVTVEGCGVYQGTCTNVANGTGTGAGNSSNTGYGDNQAAPLTLFQFTPNGTTSATFVNALVLPQTASGANVQISGEYGSSSEGTLQLSGQGQYLTLLGYGIDALSFNANPNAYSPAVNSALAQSGSLTGQSYTPVPRVLTLIDANGNVNSSTTIFNIFNTNNPRSAYTLNGTTAYVSGQGTGSDATGGVFLVPVGSSSASPTAITGLDTTSKTIAQDTRDVQIYSGTLYVSVDSKEGSGSNRDFIGTLGTPPATTLFNSSNGPTQLSNFGTSNAGKETITTGANANGNNLNAGQKINLSPVNYFFASPSVLYVADSGFPKNDSNGDSNSSGTTNIGNGGLQKWINSSSNGSGTWSLAYTLYQNLNLVNNGGTSGTTGLYGLAGTVSGNTVMLYATSYTIADLDPTFLYGITDNLTYTTASQAAGETFTQLAAAPLDSNFKGVSFAPIIPAGDVEVTTVPSGLGVTTSGTGCAPSTFTTPQTLTWTPGSSCTLSVVSPQYGGTGVQYVLEQWQDGTTGTSDVVTAPATTATYTAVFTTECELTTTSGAGGSVSAGGYYAAGTEATITATPSAGYYFVNFTGSTTSTSNPLTVTMNSPMSITANFAAQTAQAITFTTAPPQSAANGSSFTVAATGGGSGNPIVFTSAGGCTNSGATYTMTSATTACSVIANQAGNAYYSAAPQVSYSVSAWLPAPAVTIAGSSAMWQALGQAAALNISPASCAWTRLASTDTSLYDARPSAGVNDHGDLWAVWTPGTGGTCAAPGSGSQVYVYISVDSTVGTRCLFAQPQCALVTSVTAGAAGANLLGGVADTALPGSVLTSLNGSSVSIAATDILPVDAKFATFEALSPCGLLNSGSQFQGLGYGPGPVGGTISSYYSSSAINVVDFNVYGADPITGTAIPSYSITPVGASPVVVFVNTSNASGFGSASLTNITRTTLGLYFGGVFVRTADATSQAFAGTDATYYGVTALTPESLSGAYQVLEQSIANNKELYRSQETGNCTNGNGGVISNPLNLSRTAGGTTGYRNRVIGNSEMLSQAQLVEDSIGYAFWSAENFANASDLKYLTVDGVDPIQDSYTGGALPQGTALANVTLSHVADGSYPIWSEQRFITTGAALSTAQQLASLLQSQVSFGSGATHPDWITDPNLNVFHMHFAPVTNGLWSFNATNTPSDGPNVCGAGASPEDGGDAGGMVATLQAGADYCVLKGNYGIAGTAANPNGPTNSASFGVRQ